MNDPKRAFDIMIQGLLKPIIYGTKYSRTDQVKFVEDSL